MELDGPQDGNLTGSLLVAHPALLDPNFRRTILFLSHHNAEDGAIGLVLNRPLHKTFGEAATTRPSGILEHLDLYYGGPVATEHVTIASLQWRENPTAVAFHSYMGRVENVSVEPEWRPGLRAFVGYAGWSAGQLENEIAQKAWIVVPPSRELIEMKDPATAWHTLMRQADPVLRLLAEAPENPGLN